MTVPSTISIGQIAERTGLSVSAIRYYESQGLVTPERSAGGQRRFLRSDIRLLSFVLIVQQFGFTIDQIRHEIQNLPDARAPTVKDWNKISRGFRQKLDEKIETLNQLRDNLDGCIGCGCLSLEKCALYNRQDRAKKFGSGPRYLMGNRPEIR
jgi:MerR family redox-sensitive transcriptional activator SoxR